MLFIDKYIYIGADACLTLGASFETFCKDNENIPVFQELFPCFFLSIALFSLTRHSTHSAMSLQGNDKVLARKRPTPCKDFGIFLQGVCYILARGGREELLTIEYCGVKKIVVPLHALYCF